MIRDPGLRGLNAPTEILSLQQCISLLLRMQILVVDGFGDLAESRNRFKRFLDAVNSAFESLWPYDRYVQTRRYNELWDYIDLSGSNSEHMIRVEPIKVVVNMMQNFTAIPQCNSLQNFDKLDFIFIDGDLSLRPWSPAANQVRMPVILLISAVPLDFSKSIGLTIFGCLALLRSILRSLEHDCFLERESLHFASHKLPSCRCSCSLPMSPSVSAVQVQPACPHPRNRKISSRNEMQAQACKRNASAAALLQLRFCSWAFAAALALHSHRRR